MRQKMKRNIYLDALFLFFCPHFKYFVFKLQENFESCVTLA